MSSDPSSTLADRAGFGAQAARGIGTGVVMARHAGRAVLRPRRSVTRGVRTGRTLREACVELGPTYIKFGQLASSSPGLFPPSIADELRLLLDEVPPESAAAVDATIAAELGAPPQELFATFDPRPLASASIAQVHAATLADGQEVVVKVQRPGIRARLAADVRLLHHAARGFERVSRVGRMANAVAIVEDFAATLDEELNFVTEARSMERWSANLARSGDHDGVRVPAVHWPLTTARVLTMERIHGVRIDDLDGAEAAGIDLPTALRESVRAFMSSVFIHGFFHGDMHAGNVFVDGDGRVAFLDFGICGRLDAKDLELLRVTLPAVFLERDYVQLSRALYGLGAVENPSALESSAAELQAFIKPLLKKNLAEISYGELLTEIAAMGGRYGFRMPRSLVLLAKQALYCERYVKLISPDWNMLGDPEMLAVIMTAPEPEPEPARA